MNAPDVEATDSVPDDLADLVVASGNLTVSSWLQDFYSAEDLLTAEPFRYHAGHVRVVKRARSFAVLYEENGFRKRLATLPMSSTRSTTLTLPWSI